MDKEKLYALTINENDTGILSEEDFEKIVNRQDSRIINIDDFHIIVNADNRKAVEKEYQIKLEPFKEWLFHRTKRHEEVATLIHEIAEENKSLAYWEEYIFADHLENKIIKNAIKKLYEVIDQFDDEEDFIYHALEGLFDHMRKEIKKHMYEILIDKLKGELKELA